MSEGVGLIIVRALSFKISNQRPDGRTDRRHAIAIPRFELHRGP